MLFIIWSRVRVKPDSTCYNNDYHNQNVQESSKSQKFIKPAKTEQGLTLPYTPQNHTRSEPTLSGEGMMQLPVATILAKTLFEHSHVSYKHITLPSWSMPDSPICNPSARVLPTKLMVVERRPGYVLGNNEQFANFLFSIGMCCGNNNMERMVFAKTNSYKIVASYIHWMHEERIILTYIVIYCR